MTEDEWLKAKDPNAMLALVAPHLSVRQWNLLACMFVRRLGKLIAPEPLAAIVRWVEQHAGRIAGDSVVAQHSAKLPEAVAEAQASAIKDQRAIVHAANPDANPDEFKHLEGRKTNPTTPYFQEAANCAREALLLSDQSVLHAGEALESLLRNPANALALRELRHYVVAALSNQALCGLQASLALKLVTLGEQAAERDNGREVHKRYEQAVSTVQRETEYYGERAYSLQQQKERADLKALGVFLHELCGNVCQPAGFEQTWRTENVVHIAREIEHSGTFHDMGILNDALMDADYESRAIFRHCRGMKEISDDPIQHAPGCWLLDTILQREPEFFAKLPLGTPSPKKRSKR